MKKRLFLLVLALCFLSLPVFAAGLPEATRDFYVYDEEGILSDEAKSDIVRTNESLFEQTGAQVVVCILNHLPEDKTVEEAAVDIFDKWDIGTKEKDNGILLLIAMKDRKFRIEVGYGLEGAIPDMVAKEILDDMVPYFQDGNYEAGIRVAFGEILSRVEDEYQITIEGKDAVTEVIEEETDIGQWKEMIRLAVIVILIIIIFGRGNNRRGGRGGYRGPFFFPFGGGFGGGSFGGGSFGGGGGFGGGGNFGGGGSSGGGGASGGW